MWMPGDIFIFLVSAADPFELAAKELAELMSEWNQKS